MLKFITIFLALIATIRCQTCTNRGSYVQASKYSINMASATPVCSEFNFGRFNTLGIISLTFTNNTITCPSANIIVLDKNRNVVLNYCSNGKTSVSLQGLYLTVQFMFTGSGKIVTTMNYNVTDVPTTTTSIPLTTTSQTTKAPTTTVAPLTTASSTTAAPTNVTSPFPDYTKCGIPTYAPIDTETRIVNGIEAARHSWPWQVFVFDGQYMCGGSLINNQWILTAAHCITATLPSIYLGSHDIFSAEKIIKASKTIMHEKYPEYPKQHDIALIKLSQPVTYSDKVSPVCLPTQVNVRADRVAMVTGWGTQENGETSSVLKQVAIPIHNLSDCPWPLTNNQICAGNFDPANVKDSCQGDSGGPLLTKNGKNYVLDGIVSFGGSTCDGYGVYTNVYPYMQWITNTVKAN